MLLARQSLDLVIYRNYSTTHAHAYLLWTYIW